MFLDAVVDPVEPVDIWFLWRLQCAVAGNELVLETAVNGRADGAREVLGTSTAACTNV